MNRLESDVETVFILKSMGIFFPQFWIVDQFTTKNCFIWLDRQTNLLAAIDWSINANCQLPLGVIPVNITDRANPVGAKTSTSQAKETF